MDWLSQNWVWVILATGVLAYLLHSNRMRHGGRFDSMAGEMLHAGGTGEHHARATPDTSRAAGHRTAHADTTGAAIDPVTGTEVQISAALTSDYGGPIYYFASAENRARFEAAPGQFVHDEAGRGLPVQDNAPAPRQHHRHGC